MSLLSGTCRNIYWIINFLVVAWEMRNGTAKSHIPMCLFARLAFNIFQITFVIYYIFTTWKSRDIRITRTSGLFHSDAPTELFVERAYSTQLHPQNSLSNKLVVSSARKFASVRHQCCFFWICGGVPHTSAYPGKASVFQVSPSWGDLEGFLFNVLKTRQGIRSPNCISISQPIAPALSPNLRSPAKSKRNFAIEIFPQQLLEECEHPKGTLPCERWPATDPTQKMPCELSKLCVDLIDRPPHLHFLNNHAGVPGEATHMEIVSGTSRTKVLKRKLPHRSSRAKGPK